MLVNPHSLQPAILLHFRSHLDNICESNVNLNRNVTTLKRDESFLHFSRLPS